MRVKQISVRVALVLTALSGMISLAAAVEGCAPGARDVRCANGGECKEADPKYAYCLDGRCVECVGRGSCGAHEKCSSGQCVPDSD